MNDSTWAGGVGHSHVDATGISRRGFIRLALATSLAGGTMPSTWAGADVTAATGTVPCRALGRTGERVSAIGLGGSHIGRPRDEAMVLRLIRSAIDSGITFMDNSWDYNKGLSEQRMGKALADGYRNKVFLMTKVDGRTKSAAARQIDESLRRLQTDRVDLLQFHEIIRQEDPDRIFAPGGAIEAVLEARTAGKLRFIGFTGHKDPAIHLHMLDVAAKHSFRFDTVQMPLNVMDAHFRSFEREVLPVLLKQEIGVLGMKSMGDGVILKSGVISAPECLRYALNLPVATVITGIDSAPILEQALEAARNFSPLAEEELSAMMASTSMSGRSGKFELFKTKDRFDSTMHNPEWLG